MKYDFVVLGADGIQGLIVTKDLLQRGYSILVADIYKTKIGKLLDEFKNSNVVFKYIDLRDIEQTKKLLKQSKADIVINCADMWWNINVYKACVANKMHCVDLGSWIEATSQQLRMDKEFKKINRTAITGCGSVPGIGNVMLNYASDKFDSLTSINAGFSWDSNMEKWVVPFSMKSILEEFTCEPRLVENGKWVKRKPLEIVHEKDYRGIGMQKCFLVQHPELLTFYHYFKNKGLKTVRFFGGYPEHSLEKICSLIDMGFHSDKPLKIDGLKIAPLDVLAPVLKKLNSPKGYKEQENLWVDINGIKDGKPKNILMECIVPPVKGWYDSGCNIDTGFPAVIMAEMIKDGRITSPGSFAPEAIVPIQEFFDELKKRNFVVYENGKSINTGGRNVLIDPLKKIKSC
ncbi:MAG: saccharopine dehydrogenase C-terminal domain-containing protein [Patescibacteria group bacterium]